MVKYDVANTPIVDLVNNIILVAVKSRASDIHFDPLENGLKIRMRIDGNLQDHTIIPKDSERNVTTRIKLISGMNITENRLPQDGAIKGRIDNLDLDMRVSVLPTNEGEKVVIRILDYSMSLEGLNRLDFSPSNYEKVVRMTQVPNGIILVTGATGSGKSTTTYAMLQTLNKEETNIITVEDPIEMNIEGINQVQVNSEIGMTFAAALRSILRQDPNVILIGEIRDSETARIAVRASITGHVVLSTVHTNDSLSTIERLIDMDVERYLLSTALEGIISQKLARRLCPYCKKTRPATPYEKMVFKDIMKININEMWEPAKCDHCINGFWGRIAIQEVLTVNDEIRDIINKTDSDKDELRKMVYEKNDTITLLEDGLDKVAKGFTTFEEIYKLIEIDEALMMIHQNEENQDKLEESENVTPTVAAEDSAISISGANIGLQTFQNTTPATTGNVNLTLQTNPNIKIPSTLNVTQTPTIDLQPSSTLPITIENSDTMFQPMKNIQSSPTITENLNLNPPIMPTVEATPPPTMIQAPPITISAAPTIEQPLVENSNIEPQQIQGVQAPSPTENIIFEQSPVTNMTTPSTEIVQTPPLDVQPTPIIDSPTTTTDSEVEKVPLENAGIESNPVSNTEMTVPEEPEASITIENPTVEATSTPSITSLVHESTEPVGSEVIEPSMESAPTLEIPTIEMTEPQIETTETENLDSNEDNLI